MYATVERYTKKTKFSAETLRSRESVAVGDTSEGSEFQTEGAEHRKACFAFLLTLLTPLIPREDENRQRLDVL